MGLWGNSFQLLSETSCTCDLLNWSWLFYAAVRNCYHALLKASHGIKLLQFLTFDLLIGHSI